MIITINKEIIDIEENTTLSKLFETLSIRPRKGMAVAVNNEVVAQTNWPNHQLQDNDRVLYFAAIQGG